MKNKLAKLFSWVLTLSSVLYPSQSQAIQAAEELEKREKTGKKEAHQTRWTKSLSKSYAKALMSKDYPEWKRSEFRSLTKLWGKESAWDHTADNPKSSAFGIPQLLKMKPSTPAPEQIARGLAYIKHRYNKPSVAWAHWRKHNWY